MSATPPRAIRVEPPPAVVGEFGPDYADSFQIDAVPGASARSWMDSRLHGSDAAKGLFRSVVWHGLLRFDLADADEAGTAFGWRVSFEDVRRVVLDTDGPLAAGRMVFDATDDTVTWTTMLRYHHPVARFVWGVLAFGHRSIAPSCLERASIHLRRSARVTAG
jgi:hypothetical protein